MPNLLTNKFHSNSYLQRIRQSIFSIIGCLIFSFFLLWIFSSNLLKTQIYENTAIQTNYVSQKITERLAAVENVALQAIDDDSLQEWLKLSNEENSHEHILIKKSIQQIANKLIRDNPNIKQIYLINNNDLNLAHFMNDRENIIVDKPLNHILNSFNRSPAKGKWFFSPSLTQAVYAQQIFETKGLSLNYLGTILLITDLSFIKENINKINHSDDLLFGFQYKNDLFYSLDKNKVKPFQIISQFFETHNQSEKIITVDKSAYFSSTITSNEFKFIYAIPTQKILKNMIRTEILIVIITIAIITLLISLIVRVTNKWTQPINHLANKMRIINNTKDLDSLQSILIPENQSDEISTLYKSYNIMIKEIMELITDNYKIKMLSQEMEFENLQSQLDPHFLYNTLDSINWLAVANDQKEISKMITALSLLFRKKIANGDHTISLNDELELVNAYVTIQQQRFRNRFEYIELNFLEDTTIKIPKLCIQPIIENSFKYAVEKMTHSCTIILKIEEKNDQILIQCSDNGPGFQSENIQNTSTGIGLKNIKERLTLHYGKEGSLAIHSIPFEQTTIILTIPKNMKGEKNDKESFGSR